MALSSVPTATMPGSSVPLLRSPVKDCRPRRAVQGLLVSAMATAASAHRARRAAASHHAFHRAAQHRRQVGNG